MVRHCGLWRNHLLRHQPKFWECTFQMRYNFHYQICIHTYDPGSHYTQTRHIHLSCLFFHHLLSTFQHNHHFYNKDLCLNNTFHPTNHHSNCIHHIPTIDVRIPNSSMMYNHYVCMPSSWHNHQTGNNCIQTRHLGTDIRSHPNYHHSSSLYCISMMMTHCTLVKVWNLRNWFFQNIDKKHKTESSKKC